MRIERPSALPVIDPKLTWAGEAICLEWETQTDRQYVVQAKMALTDLDWSELATLPGNGELVTYCLDQPVDFSFFRILESEQEEPRPLDEFAEIDLNFEGDQLCLQWNAESQRQYFIEGRRDLLGTLADHRFHCGSIGRGILLHGIAFSLAIYPGAYRRPCH